jgi:hypothetical protein
VQEQGRRRTTAYANGRAHTPPRVPPAYAIPALAAECKRCNTPGDSEVSDSEVMVHADETVVVVSADRGEPVDVPKFVGPGVLAVGVRRYHARAMMLAPSVTRADGFGLARRRGAGR